MKEYYLTKEKIDAFASMLYQAEKSKATIEKYLRSIRMFSQYLAGNPVNKSAAITWKEQLQQQNNYAPSTVNAALAALNNLFSFLGWTDCRTHYLKIQRRLFRDAGQELCREDYERLVSAAYNTGHKKIALIMETICATGIRVSELRYVTVEAARAGQATVFLKGKIRTIILPSKLCRKLLDYAKTQKNTSGETFLSRGKKSMGRCRIWAEMKDLCPAAGI